MTYSTKIGRVITIFFFTLFLASCGPSNPVDKQLNKLEKAIVMLYMEDRSYEEMEEVLGISGGTLRVKMSRIKEKLRHLAKATHYGT